MAIEYFHAYHSYLKSIEPLNDTERGRLFTALLEYSSTGQVPDVRGNERFIFPTMKEQIDRDKQKYDAKCLKRSENAKKRWDANECNSMQMDANACKSMQADANDAKEKEKTKEKEKKKEKEKEYNPLTPLFDYPKLVPVVESWLAYKEERREKYKPTGLKALVSEIKNNADAYGEDAVIAVINASMSAMYKGIVFDRLKNKKGDSNAGSSGNAHAPQKFGHYV